MAGICISREKREEEVNGTVRTRDIENHQK